MKKSDKNSEDYRKGYRAGYQTGVRHGKEGKGSNLTDLNEISFGKIDTCKEKVVSEWIPITYCPMEEEYKNDYAERTGYDVDDLNEMLNCSLPEDGQTVLITDKLGNVEVDTFINDYDGCYFECNCDMTDIKAWMPLPEPYKM